MEFCRAYRVYCEDYYAKVFSLKPLQSAVVVLN
jgi:hypothetical protein